MKTVSVMGLFVCFIGIQANASVVYEGFDYTVDSAIWGQGSGDGWDGNWVGSDNNPAGTPAALEGLSFGPTTPGIGGAYGRPARNGIAESSRPISSASQATLTADNTTTWFSIVMNSGAVPSGAGGQGYAANSHGTIVLGDAKFVLSDDRGNSAAYDIPFIEVGGNALGVGFDGVSGNLIEDISVQGVIYEDGVGIASTNDRIFVATNTVMLAGKIEWAANGTEDVMSVYNIIDLAAELPEAFTTMSADLDQSTFNLVAICQGQTEVFDEIRFGTSAQDVGLGEEYEGSAVLMIDYAEGFVMLNATNLEYAATHNLQSAESLMTSDLWNNLYSVSNVTEAAWTVPVSNSATFFRIN